jgi:exodeoxyribonuclease VII large subunit
LGQLARRLRRAVDLAGARRSLEAIARHLAHLDPTQVLGRGYSIVRDGAGHVVRASTGLAKGDPLEITFGEGSAGVTVRETR